ASAFEISTGCSTAFFFATGGGGGGPGSCFGCGTSVGGAGTVLVSGDFPPHAAVSSTIGRRRSRSMAGSDARNAKPVDGWRRRRTLSRWGMPDRRGIVRAMSRCLALLLALLVACGGSSTSRPEVGKPTTTTTTTGSDSSSMVQVPPHDPDEDPLPLWSEVK